MAKIGCPIIGCKRRRWCEDGLCHTHAMERANRYSVAAKKAVAARVHKIFLRTGLRPVDARWRKHVSRFMAFAKSIGYLPDVKSCRCADCGKRAAHWEHRDYTRPLDVEPVCARCNILRGPAIVRKFRNART